MVRADHGTPREQAVAMRLSLRSSTISCVFLVCVLGATCAGSVRAATAVSPAERSDALVVLVPGFGGRDSFPLGGRYFMGLDDALTAAGFDVVTLAPPPVATSEERGAWLAVAINQATRGEQRRRVVVIAHSQGGVDVRAALDRGAHIHAVATLSTPHHGTDVAEVALAWPRPLVRAALHELNRGAPSPFASASESASGDAADLALVNLTREGMHAFNARHPKSPVPLFSVAAFSGADIDDACAGGRWSRPRKVDALHPMLLAGRAMIRWQRDVSDDGVVPTRSMRFGTFLGCVAADHVDWQRWDVEHDDVLLDDHRGRFSRTRSTFDVHAFIVELARGLDAVARARAEDAMDAHVANLAAMAGASPLNPQ